MKKNNRVGLYIIIIVLAIFFTASYFFSGQKQEIRETNITEIAEVVESGNVKEIVVKGNLVTATLNDDRKIKAYKENEVGLKEYGISTDKVKITVEDTSGATNWGSIIFTLVPILIIGGIIFYMMRSAQGANSKAMGFGKANAKLFMGGKQVKFADVAGSEEAKQELFEIVDFLKNPKKYRELGAEIPRGVLLVGSPGTGKTLMARAVAGEAGVPFFSISASEFVEMFVGVGASRVRDLFQKAKRNAPAIIFIDELDAVGRQRGAGLGGSHDEREQTLNQILVEMDGFETTDNVIVVSATNRPDVLDPALLRPGRFDRQVIIDLPDRKERQEILKVHLKNKPVESNVNLDKIAGATAGFAGADLRNLTNEAAIFAARQNKKTISQADMNESIEKVMMGPEKRSRLLSEKERKITAYHEAGHAVVSHLLPEATPVHKVSIISRGMALGYTWKMPVEDKRLETKAQFEDEISSLMAGRSAEELFFGKDQITTGAQNDLKRATGLARKMVTEFGMSEKLGPQIYGHKEEMPFLGKDYTEHRNYSEEVAKIIDAEVSEIIRKAKKRADQVLDKNRVIVERISHDLLQKETIEEEDFNGFFKNKKEN